MIALRVALVSAFSLLAGCTGGASSTNAGDGGADDADTGAASCTQERGDACTAGIAMRCDGAPPPGCLTTTTANVYCCGAVSDGGATDGGSDGGKATSPDGVPYPTDNIGWNARTGSKAGQTIANITLPGYAPNSATPATVSMADLFDPNGKTHDAIVLLGVSVWDVYSPKAMETALASTRRIRVLSVLGEGPSAGNASSAADFIKWRGAYPKATHMHDPGFKAFGAAFDAAAVPLTMIIVAKTMEICSSGVGAQLSPTNLDRDINGCVR